ncbi:RICIN domain-containing protein [Streptomyces sp. R11]|uniref:RICIN domain-containing protein n=1 Tax=Streptomyces sp. R11 TaxID=3238625 RepID=A0AB39NES2_9ACTN
MIRFRAPRTLVASATCALAAAVLLPSPAAGSSAYYQGQGLFEKSDRVWTATGGAGGSVTYSTSNGSPAQQWSVVQASGRPAGQVNYINRNTGLCMDVDKSGPNQGHTIGARVIQQECSGTLSQVWELRTDWDPFFKKAYAVQNKLSLYSLTVKGGSEADGAALVQEDLLGGWGGYHQFWYINPVS